MRYLITFSCYGSRLPGDDSGSVDRRHNQPGSPTLEPNQTRALRAERQMVDSPYLLNSSARVAVLQSLQEVCQFREWTLLAAHVRQNHVHAVVEADTSPEVVMSDFKRYASRRLNLLTGEISGRRRWTRHGSTRWLWKDQDVRDAIRYVADEQGEPLAVFVGAIP